MLYEEFVRLTGYAPSYDEYAEIERNYMVFDGDKKEFCKAWTAVNAATVEEYKATREKILKMERKKFEVDSEIKNLESKIARLQERFDKMVNWSRELKSILETERDKINRIY